MVLIQGLRYLYPTGLCPVFRSCSVRPCSRQPTRMITTNTSTHLQHEPRTFPTSGFDVINASDQEEEETLPGYYPEKYYPVRLGEIFEQRYRVVGKLGYGTTSTVWLARDLLQSRYVTLKMYVSGSRRTRELEIYDHLNCMEETPDHPGKSCIRKLFGSFQVDGPNGNHLCLVHEPLGLSLAQIAEVCHGHRFSLETLKPCLRQVLIAVDFLHAKAGIIHTDIQTTNLLSGVSDPEILSVFENAEFIQPTPRKMLEGGRVIYVTRRMPLRETLPLLCDFGEARFKDESGTPGEDIMPDLYKAPEVILDMEWDFKVDVWNMGMVIWHLVTGKPMFKGRSPDGTFQDDRVHLAEMVAIMGPPPMKFLRRIKTANSLWNEDGSWKNTVPIPENTTLEILGADIVGEDKEGFLRFVRRILRWDPEERPTCEELVFDPWLMEGLGKATANNQ